MRKCEEVKVILLLTVNVPFSRSVIKTQETSLAEGAPESSRLSPQLCQECVDQIMKLQLASEKYKLALVPTNSRHNKGGLAIRPTSSLQITFALLFSD